MINRVTLLGNICSDVTKKQLPTGDSVAEFRLATNEKWTDKQGNKQEKAEFHSITVFGKLADLCGQYLSKGRQVYLEGKIVTRSWDDKEGKKCYKTEIKATTVQFLGSNGEKSQSQPASPEFDTSSIPF